MASASIRVSEPRESDKYFPCLFQVYKEGKKIHEMVGASKENLENLVAQLASS
jgi:hypothetical protein